MSADLALLSASELARRIRAGRASSRAAVEACLARIGARNGELNAFIAIDAEHARATADLADAEARRGRWSGPLHGVPLAHKDMYYRQGRIATCGSKIRRDWVAPATATPLARLDAAGALDLGTLNMVEFAFGPTGHNWHLGHARNAWNPLHITGGSSSGSATGVAARMIYAALGSDTGGSIRLPAHYCGVVGIKPTWGRVSRANAMPLSWSLDTVGPLTRTVEDAALILSIIAGPDVADPTAAAEPVPDYVALLGRGVKRLRIGVPTSFFTDVDGETSRVLAEAESIFASLGAEIVRVPMPDIERLNAYCSMVLACEAATIHREWLRTHADDYSPQIRARLEGGLMIPATLYLDALRARGSMLAEFNDKVFGLCDVLMAPVAASAAPTILESDVPPGPDLPARLGVFPKFTRSFNYLGLPGLAVPGGVTASGLPIGFQLIGPPFAEAMLFAAGHAFQQATNWHDRV
ncbi:MAG: amidase [Proteobacteria bacterium]|nr:amidase [Pseudomonadota bacterium]MBI3497692.1 amidase [Pseudomonadota bacterium]